MKLLIRYTFLCLILVISSCNSLPKNKLSNSVEQENIKKILYAQQKAWNNGDLNKFMQGYHNSTELTFIGSKGVTYGWIQTLENYTKSYPDRATMGELKFDILELNRLSSDSYHMIGKYTLIRKDDEPFGYFTLIWKKISGQWLIISDHTSG